MTVVAPITVRSAQGNYQVQFVDDVRDVAGAIGAVDNLRAVIDERVARLHEAPLGALAATVPMLALRATEELKTLDGVNGVVLHLQGSDATKKTTLACIGGGILQDTAAFSAAIYYRGIPWLFAPTTLLSMCDSCIGAKCGINLGRFKNQLGTFHSPSRVIVCVRFLDTLSEADIQSGYGEILKLALTGSAEHFRRLKERVLRDGLRGSSLVSLVRDSLEIKRTIIEADEYEADLRRVLNYGHTFGHSLEALTQNAVPHGTAVAWGLDLVNFIAFKRGLLAEDLFRDVHDFVVSQFRCRVPHAIDAKRLVEGVRRDKKAAEGHVNLVMLEKPGSLKIVRTPFDASLESHVAEYLEHHNALAVA
jgi:3-dehydroquinate synthase